MGVGIFNISFDPKLLKIQTYILKKNNSDILTSKYQEKQINNGSRHKVY